MNAAVESAPLRNRTSGPAAWVYALVFAAAAGMAVFVANQIVGGAFSGAGCGFKHLTGLPCPGCGATRSLAALAQLDVLRAFSMNPLVALVAAAAPALVPGAWLDARFNHGRAVRRVIRFCCDRKFTWLLVALVVINWAYLLLAGR